MWLRLIPKRPASRENYRRDLVVEKRTSLPNMRTTRRGCVRPDETGVTRQLSRRRYVLRGLGIEIALACLNLKRIRGAYV
jgi:hypothetical protein